MIKLELAKHDRERSNLVGLLQKVLRVAKKSGHLFVGKTTQLDLITSL